MLDQTLRIIMNIKTYNALGHDLASIKVYKMLAHKLGRHIQQLINTIIRTGIYPDILKLSKITPQLKPDKQTNKIDSYRPINKLCTLDKIIEPYIKTHFDKYLDTNDIIHKHHHGSRKGHGTDTATEQIQHEQLCRYEDNKMTATIQTDLSAAFDTIDATALTDKLHYYRVTGT